MHLTQATFCTGHKTFHSKPAKPVGLRKYNYFATAMCKLAVLLSGHLAPLSRAAHVLAASRRLQARRGSRASPESPTCCVPPLTPNRVRSPHAAACSAAAVWDSGAKFRVRCCCWCCCSFGRVCEPECAAATQLRPVRKRAAWGFSVLRLCMPMHRAPAPAVGGCVGAALAVERTRVRAACPALAITQLPRCALL